MLNNLQTSQFKKVGTKEFSFTPGLNVLRGPNWSGKSSTLNAIKFALQGIQGIPGSKDDVQTWGTSGKCDSSLEILNHKVIRSLKDCNIYKGDDVVATGHTACNAYLDQLFGISTANYNLLSFSDQGETAGLLTIGATELQKIVETIADVTVVDRILKLTSSDLSEFKGRLEGRTLIDTKDMKVKLKGLVAGLVPLLQRAATTKVEIDILVSEKGKLVALNTDLSAKITKQIEDVARLKYVREQVETLSPYVISLAKKIENEPKEAKTLTNEKVKVDKELSRLTDQANELSSSKDRVDIIRSWLEGSAEAALSEEREYVDTRDYLKEVITELTDEVYENKIYLSESTKKLESLKESIQSGVCETCHRAFESDKDLLESQELELEGTKHTVSKLKEIYDESVAKLTNKSAELNALIEPITLEVQSVIDGLTSELKELEEGLKLLPGEGDLSEELERVFKQSSRLGVEIEDADKLIKDYNETKLIYDKELRALTNLKFELDSTEDSSQTLTELKGSLEKAVKKIEQVSETLERLHSEFYSLRDSKIPEVKSAIEVIGKEVSDADLANKALRDVRKSQVNVKKLSEYLRSSRTRFLQTIWNRVLGHASTFCKTCTGGDVEGIVRDEKGKFKFIENGVERPVTSASGAQRAFMGVGVRLGMSKALYGDGSFLVLDEPSADMSVKNSTKLVSALVATGMQIIYSTHTDLEELSASSVIDLGEM